jgi:acyl-CoA thioesterase-1
MSWMRGAAVVMMVVYLTTIACANPETSAPAPAATPRPAAGVPLVVFLGDSLTAGYGLAQDEAFPARVGELLSASGHPIRVVNAGVSGDTTGDGLARLDWLLKQKPDVLVVGLGANDALRGQDPAGIEENLRQIVSRAKRAEVRVLLLGMKIPPSYGQVFTSGFGEIYPRLAKEQRVPLVPFLLEGVGGRTDLNLDDGIHPNAEGQRIVARTVAPHLEKIVAEVR